MEDHRQVKLKDTQANKDRKLMWQYHCQTVPKVRGIPSDNKKHLIVLPVVRVPGRERGLLETMQLAIGEIITDSSQGHLPSPRV